MHILFELFLTFAKIGLFTFGGGYAMISVVENTCVHHKKWITHDEMMNITVIAESTPGPMAINCATFVGYKQGGFIGSVCATLGIVFPSFVIIYIISMFLKDFLEITVIAHAFQGIKVAVGILIFNAAINMIKKMKKDKFSYMMLFGTFGFMLWINVFSIHFSSIYLMMMAAIISLAVFQIHHIKEKGDMFQ